MVSVKLIHESAILKKYLSLVLLMLACPSWAQPVDASMQLAVQQMLDHHYGQHWDQPNACRRFETSEGWFCMQLMRIEPITIDRQQYLYVMSAGESYNSDGKLGENGHAQAGLGGLFVLVMTLQGWRTAAATAAITNGQWGIPQIDQLKLTQIGAKRWGWVGRMGGSGAGGESNEQWLVYAPIGRVVKEIANLDAAHDYTGQDFIEQISTQWRWLRKQPMDAGFYRVHWSRQVTTTPLDTDRLEPIASSTKIEHTQGIAKFDQTAGQYTLIKQTE